MGTLSHGLAKLLFVYVLPISHGVILPAVCFFTRSSCFDVNDGLYLWHVCEYCNINHDKLHNK